MTLPGECCCDFFGVCTDIPPACPEIFDPVCGLEGRFGPLLEGGWTFFSDEPITGGFSITFSIDSEGKTQARGWTGYR